jgi:hypothetical protein
MRTFSECPRKNKRPGILRSAPRKGGRMPGQVLVSYNEFITRRRPNRRE